MSRLTLACLILLSLAYSTPARAQACDPYDATFKMQLFPHSANPIPFYLMMTSSGCPSFPGAVRCLAKTVLPGDAGNLTPQAALQNKCESIVEAIESSCPRFTVSDVDCDPNPGQMTQFTVTDSSCDGETPSPGDGIALLAANELTALSSFSPAGTLLTDYELDTVIAGCPGQGRNMLILSGDGGSGSSIFPGGAAAFEVFVTTINGTVSHSEPTSGLSPALMAAAQASALTDTFIALAEPVACQASGRILECSSTAAPAPESAAYGSGFEVAAGGSSEAPTVGAVTNDGAMPEAGAAGAANRIAAMISAVSSGGCEDLEDDCPALGANITQNNPLPSLGAWPIALLAITLGGLGVGFFVRTTRREARSS